MRLVRWAFALTGALAAACLTLGTPALAARACGPAGYAYAGFWSGKGAAGVGARLTALGRPVVESGHVAAWVGLGGPGEGPGGTAEWIQVGLNSLPGSSNKLYYEVAHPSGSIDYGEVDPDVATGVEERVAVLEVAGRPGTWQIWVDGKAATAPIFLPGSHGSLTPMAVAENWDGGRISCNRFAYRFGGVQLAAAPGGSWQPFSDAQLLRDPGYRVVRSTKSDFTAMTQAPLPAAASRTPASSHAGSASAAAQPPHRQQPTPVPDDGLGTN